MAKWKSHPISTLNHSVARHVQLVELCSNKFRRLLTRNQNCLMMNLHLYIQVCSARTGRRLQPESSMSGDVARLAHTNPSIQKCGTKENFTIVGNLRLGKSIKPTCGALIERFDRRILDDYGLPIDAKVHSFIT
ncbi:hypothetical protein NE237_005186 [Protea cynaroides]|uniref:Uncharacterized protein n=1 Tax=Protea cynaroides TaxID=273540 RepID=A0A9Q0QUC5_9MAGN|nr:hypothetical protein NE237_005186 [Protea cynaroides]